MFHLRLGINQTDSMFVDCYQEGFWVIRISCLLQKKQNGKTKNAKFVTVMCCFFKRVFNESLASLPWLRRRPNQTWATCKWFWGRRVWLLPESSLSACWTATRWTVGRWNTHSLFLHTDLKVITYKSSKQLWDMFWILMFSNSQRALKTVKPLFGVWDDVRETSWRAATDLNLCISPGDFNSFET